MAQRLTFDGRVQLDVVLKNDGTISGTWRLLDTELTTTPSRPVEPIWIGWEVIDRANHLAGECWSQRQVHSAFLLMARMAHPQAMACGDDYWRQVRLAGSYDKPLFELTNLEQLPLDPEFGLRLSKLRHGGQAWSIVSTLVPYLREAHGGELGTTQRACD
jgi:hypothetical protein